jgi:hypothetical protein
MSLRITLYEQLEIPQPSSQVYTEINQFIPLDRSPSQLTLSQFVYLSDDHSLSMIFSFSYELPKPLIEFFKSSITEINQSINRD